MIIILLNTPYGTRRKARPILRWSDRVQEDSEQLGRPQGKKTIAKLKRRLDIHEGVEFFIF